MKHLTLLFAVLFVSGTMLAQKPKNIKGNFSSLSGVSSYNVVFEYEI